MTLTFESKVRSVILNIPCNVHPMGNNCAKYKHPKSKVKGELGGLLMVETHNNIHALGFYLSKMEKSLFWIKKTVELSFISLDKHNFECKM